MSVVLLVRHGQASFGSGDYDRLSPAGEDQSRLLGRALAAQGVTPARVVAGTLRRQHDTAKLAADAAGWSASVKSDPAWNEFSLDDVVRLAPGHPATTDSAAFQVALDAGLREWASGTPAPAAGTPDAAPRETHAMFTARVNGALRRLVAETDRRGTAIVSTSAGVISAIAASLLSGGCLAEGGAGQWIRLNRVCVNAAVTKIVIGRQGTSLVSFNEHGHLAPGLVTYR